MVRLHRRTYRPYIEKAIAAQGTEIDKSMGQYVIHRDYANSKRLNAYLNGGGTVFRVAYQGRVYEVTLRTYR